MQPIKPEIYYLTLSLLGWRKKRYHILLAVHWIELLSEAACYCQPGLEGWWGGIEISGGSRTNNGRFHHHFWRLSHPAPISSVFKSKHLTAGKRAGYKSDARALLGERNWDSRSTRWAERCEELQQPWARPAHGSLQAVNPNSPLRFPLTLPAQLQGTLFPKSSAFWYWGSESFLNEKEIMLLTNHSLYSLSFFFFFWLFTFFFLMSSIMF